MCLIVSKYFNNILNFVASINLFYLSLKVLKQFFLHLKFINSVSQHFKIVFFSTERKDSVFGTFHFLFKIFSLIMIRGVIDIFQYGVFIKFYLGILIHKLWNIGRIKTILIREVIKHDSTLLWSTVIVSEMMQNMILFMLRLRIDLYSALINTCSVNSVTKVVSIRCSSKVWLVRILSISIFEEWFSNWALVVVMDCLLVLVLGSWVLLLRFLARYLFLFIQTSILNLQLINSSLQIFYFLLISVFKNQ